MSWFRKQEDRRVVAAAFLFDPDPGGEDPRAIPTTVSAPPPARHHNLFAMCWPTQPTEQGFLLSDGSFVGREEAARIALTNGQVERLTAPPRLFSEDLW